SSMATPSGSSVRASRSERTRSFATHLSPPNWVALGPGIAGAFFFLLRSAQQRGRVFGFLLAAHQLRKPFRRGDVPVQHRMDRFGDGQLDTMAACQAHDLVGGLDRFDHLPDLAYRLLDALAAAERQAEPAIARQVAGAGQ